MSAPRLEATMRFAKRLTQVLQEPAVRKAWSEFARALAQGIEAGLKAAAETRAAWQCVA